MAAEKGNLMLLQIGDGATSEVFTTIGGVRTKSIKISNTMVDISDDDSGMARELLEGAGERTVQIQVSGVYKGSSAEDALRAAAEAGTIDNYRLYFNGVSGDYYAGAFQVSDLEFTGEYRGARQFSATLDGDGDVTHTSA